MAAFRIFRRLAELLDVAVATPTDGQVLTWSTADGKWENADATGGGGGGAPADVDYLVGTASGDLSAEIVVGTSPGGELGGTWASPTVDTVHSGSSHASVQAAAEATAAAALASHAADTTGVHGIADTSVLETTAGAQSKADAAESVAESYADSAVSTHSADTTSVHGIADTSVLLTTSAIGSTVEAHDADLTSIAALSSATSGAIASDGAGWVKKTYAQFKTALALVASDVGLGNVTNDAQLKAANLDTDGTLTANSDAKIASQKATKTYVDAHVAGTDGWTAAGETWTYASADSPTFTFTVAADVTAKYSAGMRIKLTQTTVKYFIITAVSTFSGGNTTITVYGGTDYTLANASITSPFWSMVKAPFGFPLDPAKWTVTTTDSTARSQATPALGTWYNLGAVSISIPIGIWDVSYSVNAVNSDATNGNWNAFTTLSTGNNTESDSDFTVLHAHLNVLAALVPHHARKSITLTSKSSYFLNTKTTSAGLDSLQNSNDNQKLIIRAVCAYL